MNRGSRPGVRPRREGTEGNRRGATLVLFALVIVPLMAIAALAIDVSRWQVGANQLQVAADAGALAGARAAMMHPTNAGNASTDPLSAAAYARNAAAANTAFNADVSITDAAVEPYWYDPITKAATAATWTAGAYNAVKVTTSATGSRIFSRVVQSSASPTVTRSAIAWIANINNGSCVKPWALPYTALYDRVQSIITGGTASTTNPRPNLTQAAMAQLNGLSEATRILIFRPPTYPTAADSLTALGNLGYNNGMYSGYNFLSPSGNNNASTTTLQENTFGCSSQLVSVNTANGATLPGNNDIPCAVVNGLMGSSDNQCEPSNLTNWNSPQGNDWPSGNNKPRINQPVTCFYKAPVGTYAWDAGCYSSPTAPSPGSMQTVAWGDNVYNGSNATDFREIGRFKVVCVFRGIYTPRVNAAGHSETCTVGTTVVSGYPLGTIVGVIQGFTSPILGPNVELGNVISDQQRLVLVR